MWHDNSFDNLMEVIMTMTLFGGKVSRKLTCHNITCVGLLEQTMESFMLTSSCDLRDGHEHLNQTKTSLLPTLATTKQTKM